MKQKVQYDENHTRLRLVKSIPGKKPFNFLFIPGGPGVDANCFIDLIHCLDAPGEYWLIDFPFNGTNQPEEISAINICEKWDQFLIDAVRSFEKPVLIGHSFGGYLPLFCPELEGVLDGLIILNSVPTIHSEIFAAYAKKHEMPSLERAQKKVAEEPSLQSIKELYLLESYYFFSSKNRYQGVKQLIEKLEYCIPTEHWWYTKGPAYYDSIKWVPDRVPTLILGGTDDLMTPLEVFEQSSAFQRDNIEMKNIEDAGHFPWLEKPEKVNHLIRRFLDSRL